MENRSSLHDAFTSTFKDHDGVLAPELVDLSTDELSDLATGVAALPDPVRAACQVVLDDWQRLDVAARVAALLVLANALAGAD